MIRAGNRLLRSLPGAVVRLALLALPLAGCRLDMHDQPKYETFEQSKFFPNGSAMRTPPANTVARGAYHDPAEAGFYSGFGPDDRLLPRVPMAVDSAALARGQYVFNTYCAPCHDRVGTGRGMVVRRGYKQPASFHEQRLIDIEDGHFFDAMSRGFGQMPSYAAQIKPADRWKVVAYVRALQLSQGAKLADLPAEDRQRATQAGLLQRAPEPPIGNYDRTPGGPGLGGDPSGPAPAEEPTTGHNTSSSSGHN